MPGEDIVKPSDRDLPADHTYRDWALFFWMLGVSVAHALRFVVFDDPVNRMVVAAGGVVIYAVAAFFALNYGYQKVAWLICGVFPLVGLTLVLVTGAEVDNWQLAVGVTQFAAIPYVLLLWHWRKG